MHECLSQKFLLAVLGSKVRILSLLRWQPTPVLLPGESHRWRSLVGYSPWSRKESDMTERLHFLTLFNTTLLGENSHLGLLWYFLKPKRKASVCIPLKNPFKRATCCTLLRRPCFILWVRACVRGESRHGTEKQTHRMGICSRPWNRAPLLLSNGSVG